MANLPLPADMQGKDAKTEQPEKAGMAQPKAADARAKTKTSSPGGQVAKRAQTPATGPLAQPVSETALGTVPNMVATGALGMANPMMQVGAVGFPQMCAPMAFPTAP